MVPRDALSKPKSKPKALAWVACVLAHRRSVGLNESRGGGHVNMIAHTYLLNAYCLGGLWACRVLQNNRQRFAGALMQWYAGKHELHG